LLNIVRFVSIFVDVKVKVKVKVKVNLSLYVVKPRSVKAYGRTGDIAL
jgi:hypothetical protein